MSTIALAPPVRSSVASPARGQVRLTRRGRVVVFLLAFAFVALAAVLVTAGSAATGEEGSTQAVEIVTVAPGETLWAIASDVAAASGDDVRDVMEQIQQLNTLDGAVVYAGQQLRIPTA